MAADADAPEPVKNVVTPTAAKQWTTEEPNLGESADDLDGVDYDAVESTAWRANPVRLAILSCVVMVLALGGLVGWLGLRTYQSHHERDQRELFLQVARQGAVDLTTIDWQNVDHDITRILDSATGKFYDDFSQRTQPFIDVVKKVQSTSVGTVTEAGLESMSDNDAQVIVAVSVKTSNVGAVDQPPQGWRMKLEVQKVDGGAKVSNVVFVPI